MTILEDRRRNDPALGLQFGTPGGSQNSSRIIWFMCAHSPLVWVSGLGLGVLDIIEIAEQLVGVLVLHATLLGGGVSQVRKSCTR